MVENKFGVDLQWFADGDPSGGNGEEVPEVGFSSYDEGIEILSPEQQAEREKAAGIDPELGSKTREELLADLQEIRKTAADAPPVENPEVAALKAELAQSKGSQQSGLTVEQLQQFAALQGVQPKQAQESVAEFKERMKEHLYDDPVAMMDEYFSKKLSPEIRRLASNNQFQSQKFLELDPEKGETYKKYKSEVDLVVEKLPPQDKLYDPDIYTKAYQQVMATHIDDIIAAKVQEAIKTQGIGGVPAPAAEVKVSYAETGVTPNPTGATAKKVVVLTPTEKALAANKGVSDRALAAWKLRHPNG